MSNSLEFRELKNGIGIVITLWMLDRILFGLQLSFYETDSDKAFFFSLLQTTFMLIYIMVFFITINTPNEHKQKGLPVLQRIIWPYYVGWGMMILFLLVRIITLFASIYVIF